MASRESPPERLRNDFSGPDSLGDAVAVTRQFALDQGLGSRDRAHLCIIVEELIANSIDYGGDTAKREISLELARGASSIVLAIEDNGVSFDPRNLAAPDSVPLRGGGAGLRLVSAWSEIVSYRSEQGRNRLELNMPLTEA